MRHQYTETTIILIFIITCTAAASAQGLYPAFPSPGPYTLGQGYFAPKEPGKTFHEARQNFLDEEYKIAAEDIRKGAVFIKVEAARGTKESHKLLGEAAQDLEKLAVKVENGTADSARELDEAFASAHHALARHYILTAGEAWAKKETTLTGQYLQAAAYHFMYAMAWDSRKLETASLAAIKKSRTVARKLIEGSDYAAEDVSKALETMSGQIATKNKQPAGGP